MPDNYIRDHKTGKPLLREAYIRNHATCEYVLAWIPVDEPYSSPPPGATLRDYATKR